MSKNQFNPGIIFDLDSYNLQFKVPVSFNDLGWDTDFTDYFTEHNLGYYGITIGIDYRLLHKEKSDLVLTADLQILGFIPYKWDYNPTAITDQGNYIDIIKTTMITYHSNPFAIAPRLGLSFIKKITQFPL